MKDLYWIAGLIEGEGSFDLAGSSSPRIQIGMTDRDVMERAREILSPTHKLYEYQGSDKRDGWNPSRKPLFSCNVSGVSGAAWMMTLYPLMGARRRERIRSVLSSWRNKAPGNRSKTVCKRGHPYNEANTIITNGGKSRWCRECQRLHGATRRATMPEATRQKYMEQSRDYRRAQRAAFVGPRRPPGRRRPQEV